MAQVEPMDIDSIESDFDNKENTFHHSNVLPRTPCTEKGYEELDVSELNMKLRYSVTPTSSPMSKSLTGAFLDNRTNPADDCLNNIENSNLTRSLNSTLTKTEHIPKSKALPLQTLSADPFVDNNRNSSIRRLIDPNDNNVTISVSTNDIDDNLSLPSTSSSVAPTPEATTPTKEIPKPEGSPILRGLKSVLSIFRPSQSPIPPADDKTPKQDILSPIESQILTSQKNESKEKTVLVSTPLAADRQKEGSSSRRSSPLKESVVFNDDLEKELQWKDETTIIFKQEKIPVHKLFFRNPLTPESDNPKTMKGLLAEHNTTVEYMDISHNESMVPGTVPGMVSTKIEEAGVIESDNEFLDCETTFPKNESYTSDFNLEKENKTQVIENMPINLTQNVTAEIDDSKFKCAVSITECIKPGDLNLEPSEEITIADFNNTNSNTSKIIQATMEFLRNETYDHINDNVLSSTQSLSSINNANLQNEIQIISHDFNAARTVDDKFISNIDKTFNIIETKSSVSKSVIENSSMKEGKENSIDNKTKVSECVEGGLSKIDNLPDVYSVTLTHVECPKYPLSEVTFKEKMDNYTDQIIVNSNTNFKNDDVKDVKLDPCDDAPVRERMDDIVLFVADNQEQSKSDKLDDTQVNNLITVCNNTSIECVHSSNEIDSNVHPVIDNNVKDADMSITKYTDNDNDIPCNVTCEISATSNIIQSKSELDSLEGNVSQKINYSYSLKTDDKPISDISLNATQTLMSVDNDRDITEMTVTSNIRVIKPPSEIPLPDEDDAEQDIKLKKNIIDEISSSLDKGYDEISTANEIESAANLNNNHFMGTKNPQEEGTNTLFGNIINGNDTEIIAPMNEFDLSELHNYINSNQCGLVKETKSEMAKDDTIDMTTVNLTHSVINNKIEALGLQDAYNTINIEEVESKEVDNKDIFEIKGSNNISDTTAEENKSITDNNVTNNKFNIKSIENISLTENTIKSVTADDLEKIAEITNVFVAKDIDRGNERGNGVEQVDEEIITSANNSPYVSVADLALDIQTNSELKETGSQDILEDIDNPFSAKTKIASSPPISSKIVSKGYNLNFDDIEDPFATKTNIRMSPTPDVPEQSCDSSLKEFKKSGDINKKINNRRKSQPERKKITQNKNLNSTFGQFSNKENVTKKNTVQQNVSTPQDKILPNPFAPSVAHYMSESTPEHSATIIDDNFNTDSQVIDENVDDIRESHPLSSNLSPVSIQQEETIPADTELKELDQTIIVSVEKSTSSSEQYYSLGTSSGESIGCMNHSKNVFNLPEIDDMNFNPFATKSKMRMSPPLVICDTTNIIENKGFETVSEFALEKKIDNNVTITEDLEVGEDYTLNKISATDCSQNISNATCSSKYTNDKEDTVREILTEDEDTIEGPFLDADDLKDIEKLTHLKVESDMMNFDEGHQEKDLNSENGELFIDADAFEFLLNQNKSTTVLDSGKESLFLKFDPLFAKRVSSDGVLAALSKVQKRQSTPKKLTATTQKNIVIKNLVPGPSNEKESYVPVEEYNDDMLCTVTKPMMVVNPAVSSTAGSRNSTPPKINRRSLTFTSPAMAVIDRLLSLSGNSSHLNHDNSIPQHAETDLAITQLRELLAEKEIHVHNLRCESKELKSRLAALEGQLKCLETESKERLDKINDLNNRLLEKTKINKSMATVVEEYERTIASLIAESEQDRNRNAEERMKLIKERDEQTAHLASMEVSFSDLHSKYEKSKQIIMNCKSNEDTYKKSIKEFEENLMKMQNNYELLKQHATSKLNYANQELEKMNRAHEAEVLKLNAMIKRKELHITSLEETLAQKTKANEELTAICDELINKVG